MIGYRDQLIREAVRVRRFLEQEGQLLCDVLDDFPTGACGSASDLLGTWLIDEYSLNPDYVHGERDGKSHGWLELNKLVVDITSDQFSDGLGAVYCGELNAFFTSFESQERSKPQVAPILRPVYEAMRLSFSGQVANKTMKP
ncbi:MAG: hypothetical protein M3O62_02670 [Pseudomonadota bacterium]|nr:hypothetical protein [Pseudomonadota bacterium]